MYEKGQGVSQDYQVAENWYRRAANKNNAVAQYNLGLMYEKGQGLTQDEATAQAWFIKACDQGLQDGCDANHEIMAKQAAIADQVASSSNADAATDTVDGSPDGR